MYTFRQFLAEETFNEFLYLLEKFEHHPDHNVYTANNDEHRIQTAFVGHHKKKDHYDIHFSVNDRVSHNHNSNPHKNRAVLHHVHKTIHEFIKKHKPKTLTMHASDSDASTQAHKGRAYAHLAKHLAKHHNGKATHGILKNKEAEHGETPWARVDFKH